MNKKGFTLIELAVVIAIFGLLAVVSSNFLIAMIQNSNQTTTANEVRQNAERALDDITSEIRSGGCVQTPNNNTVDVFPTSSCDAGGPYVEYSVDGIGGLTKTTLVNTVANGSEKLTSDDVGVCKSDSCGGVATCQSGLVIGYVSTSSDQQNHAVTVTLTVQPKPTGSKIRSDFCAKTVLSTTVTPRNGLN